MPVARGKMVIKKKGTTIAGATLVHKVDNPEDELRKSGSKERQTKQAADAVSSNHSNINPNLEENSHKPFSLPADSEDNKPNSIHSPVHNQSIKHVNILQNSQEKPLPQSQKHTIDPYLIQLDKLDALKLPPNQVKKGIRDRIQTLQTQIKNVEADQKQRKQRRAETRKAREERRAEQKRRKEEGAKEDAEEREEGEEGAKEDGEREEGEEGEEGEEKDGEGKEEKDGEDGREGEDEKNENGGLE